ncbi:MAG TPA: CHRD domain-containing protein [Candidatus Nitrosocosmicus sp.]|nr:CHRD domain-containing protein [Candidatus Nitrosocosmicus sp.]
MKNSNQITKLFVLAMTVAIAGITVVSTSLAPSPVFANVYFVTNMTGQQEVPPVDTQAVGEAILTQDLPQNQTMHYYVNVTGIQGVTQGHIHSGAEGENGPIVVTLFSFDSPQNEVLQDSNFTASNLEGPMEGKTMQDIIAAMKNGSTYINVHTEQNPNGEIRGQLMNTS